MKLSAKNIFLFDGIGAIATGLLLSQLLARFEPIFGMPKEALWILSAVAFCFAFYSISCHILVKRHLSIFLSIILTANILYCIATSALMAFHFNSLTWLGIGYFVGEIIIIALLVSIEYRIMVQTR